MTKQGFAQFRKDGYWYPVRVLDRAGELVLVAVKRYHRGRPRQYWLPANKLRTERPALS